MAMPSVSGSGSTTSDAASPCPNQRRSVQTGTGPSLEFCDPGSAVEYACISPLSPTVLPS